MKSNRVLDMIPSVTIEMEGLLSDLKEKNIDVIGLNAGEPDFNTPENIINACTNAMKAGSTKYTKVSGIQQLREAICAKLKKDNQVDYETDQVIVCTGAKQALYNAVLAVVNPGDEVIIPKPCWVSYVEIVKLAQGVPVLVDTVPGSFALDLEAIERAVTDKTRAVIINTPNNPTGAVYSEASLRLLGNLSVKNGFYVIADEVYEKLIYGKGRHVCIASLSQQIYQQAIIINGFSKAYAMTGWRLGYAAGPRDVIRSMASLQGHTTSNSTTFVQYAGVEALRGPQDSMEVMRRAFDERRRYLVEVLNSIPGIECANAEGAFYLMPDVSAYFGKKTPAGDTIKDSTDFCSYLLEEARVAVVPGAAFEAPEKVRVAYSNSLENLKKAIEKIRQALSKLV